MAESASEPSTRPRRSSISLSYTENSKQSCYTGTPDDAIKYLALHGGSQAAAARSVSCCPMQLSRTINALKAEEAWDTHVSEIRATTSPSPSAASKKLELPSPNSLSAQIQSGADRLGDGRPYGSSGHSWGQYREAHKIATRAIAKAGLSKPVAQEASNRLAESGVQIGRTTLLEAAKKAPGKSPVKMGDQRLKLPQSFIDAGRKIVVEMRELNLPMLKSMLLAELQGMMVGTPLEASFPNGITDEIYYNFLNRSDLFSNDSRPLEDDRALWRHSENAKQQYLVWAECFVDAKLAVYNARFAQNPEKYFSEGGAEEELIFWLPGAERHVASSDETDVAADETTRGRSAAQRSIMVAPAGSRRGHGIARRGRGSDRGWAKSQKERAKEPVLDTGEVAASKGGSKFTYVGSDLMSGDSTQTLIISKKHVDTLAKKIDLESVAPVSSLVDAATGQRKKARYLQTDSGGVETSTMATILEEILVPAFARGDDESRLSRAPTYEDPDDVICWDGLKQHHSLEWIRPARRRRIRTLLRYSHGSQDNQHEDFTNYAYFKPAFAGEKLKLRVDKVNEAKRKAAAEGREISAQDRIAASKLTDGDVLRCAKRPWEEAFSKGRTLEGWQQEGIYPKFNCALFWRLRQQEGSKSEIQSARPAARPDEAWLRKFDAPHSTAASINCDPKMLDDESIDTEVAQKVQSRLEGAPAPEKLPGVTAGNLFKLRGSASGEQAACVLRAKEVERRVEEELKELTREKRKSKKNEKMELAFSNAAAGLEELSHTGIAALTNDQLKGILLVHGKTPKGNKPELQQQVRDLLDAKMAGGASESAAVAEMQRLTTAAAAARAVNDAPLAMPAPANEGAAED